MKRSLSISVLLFVLIGFIGVVQAGEAAVLIAAHPSLSTWQTLPGPTGGSMADIVLSPAYPMPQTLFAGLRGQGVYRSDDGAYSWQTTGSGDWLVVDLAISPTFAADETLFALAGDWATGYTIQRTTDSGQTWQASSSPVSFTSGRRLALSPDFANDRLIYLVTADADNTFVSVDGGETFALAGGWFASHQVNELVFSPAFAADRTLFALVDQGGVYRSTDAGSSWLPLEISRTYTALAVSPDYATDGVLTAVSTDGSLYVSTNNGATWTLGSGVTLGIGGEISLTFSPTFADDQVMMAASSTDDSPARSIDGGLTWQWVGPYDPGMAYADGMIGGDVFALALAPEQDWAGVQFAATSGGVAYSSNRGDGWLQMNKGLPHLPVRSVALAPGSPNIMLAGTEYYEMRFFDGSAVPGDGNVQWSQNGGRNWRHVTGRLGRVNRVAFSPNFANDQTAFAAAGMVGQHGLAAGGLYRSTDNSATWTAVFTPAGHAFQTVALSPNFASDGTVWASAVSANSAIGLYRSTNGGGSWANIAPGRNITLLAVSPNYARDHTLFAGMGDDGIHRSVDGGVTWTRALDVAYPTALAISPAYGASRTVFAAARSSVDGATAVYRSTNNGLTWQELHTGIPTEQNGANLIVSTLAFAVDGSVLAGVQYGKAGEAVYSYRSPDGGASWQMVDGPLTAAHLAQFATTPSGSFDLFAATDTGIQQVTVHPGEAAEPGIWQSSGPRGGQADALAVSPNFANDGIAFTGEWSTNFQGSEWGSRLIKSTNFGQTWAESAAGTATYGNETAVHDYAFSPNFASDQTVFAATGGGLFQSSDGGVNWLRNEALYQGPPGSIYGVAAAPDFASSGHLMAWGGYGGLFVSEDGGDSWETAVSHFVEAAIYSPAFASDQTAFIADAYFENGQSLQRIAKTTDSGVTWNKVYSASVASLAVSPDFAVDQTLFAGGWQFYKSTDGGASWITRTVAADSGRIDSLAVSPAYALDQTIFAGASAGLYVSEDGGDSWQIVPGYEDTGISSLAISPGWPGHAVLLVGTSTGVYRLLTADFNVGETRQATQGLMILPSTVLALAPDETLLLAGTSGHGVYGSSDGGGSWQPTGLSGGTVRALAVSPDFALDQTLFAASGDKYTGYSRSTDGGASWQNLYGIYNRASLALSPDYAADQTLFATGEDSGKIKKSIDGGDSWQEVTSWDRNRGGMELMWADDGGANGRLFIGSYQGVWYSGDEGATWQQAASGLVNGYSVWTLRASPTFAVDHTLLALGENGGPDGVFKSVDGGVNWTPVNAGLPDESVLDVAFSPNFATDQTAYLVTPYTLYRSFNGGATWIAVGSPPETPGLQAVLVDSDGAVFVSSATGVWRYHTVAQDVVVNGGFEADSGWQLPQTPIPANYSTRVVYNGQRSMRIGLDNGANINGYSSARQTVTLPDEALLAQLTFYLYPVTGEETAVAAPPANPESLTTGDAQYVLLYGDGGVLLETLYWDLSNAQAWQKHTISLAEYGGQTLLLHFGVYNDGQNGATGLFVDDVSLLVMDGSLYPHRVYLPGIMR